MSDTRERNTETTDAGPPDSKPNARTGSIIFYVLTVVLTAGNSVLIRFGNDGFWLMEALLFPLAFLLCLLGPNGMLPTGLTMMCTLFAGLFIFGPNAADVKAYLVFLVVANAALIFVGGFLGSLVRSAMLYGLKSARASATDHTQADHQ